MWLVFKLACLTLILIYATPVNILKSKLGLLDMDDNYPMWKNRFIELINCPMCLGFWVGVIAYMFINPFNIFMLILNGATVGISSELINKLIKK
jgi:hypothetical protein